MIEVYLISIAHIWSLKRLVAQAFGRVSLLLFWKFGRGSLRIDFIIAVLLFKVSELVE